jgi:plasmid stabilization system protein ParE
MNYTVVWTVAARDQLALIWMRHPDRNAVTAAAGRSERRLGPDPESQGEERPPDRRILFESPLVVIYRVDVANRRVVVSHCRQV